MEKYHCLVYNINVVEIDDEQAHFTDFAFPIFCTSKQIGLLAGL